MKAQRVSQPSVALSSSDELNDAINQILLCVLRDYVDSWYCLLTSDNVFRTDLHRLLLRITGNVTTSFSEVDWVPFLTETLPSLLTAHVRLYRCMLDKKAQQPDKSHIKLFFDAEVDVEKSICREEVCVSREKEQEHLRRLSDLFLFFMMPTEEYRVPAVRYLSRELLLNALLLPTIDLLSDPDFLNRTIAYLTPSNAYSNEYFCQALRMSDSAEELNVVITQVNDFMNKLRGHDTGGDDDAFIKAQLGSLEYVRKICTIRLRQIHEGVAEKPERLLAYHLQPGERLYDMSFQELMSKSIAVVSFLDFLTSIEKHSLLRLYLNCVSFRESVNKVLNNDTSNSPFHPSILALADTASSMVDSMPSDLEGEVTDVFGDLNDSVEINDTESDTITADDLANTDTGDDAALSLQYTDAIEDLRAFGILLCSNLLRHMPLSVEPLIQRILRTLTSQRDSLDPDIFFDIETQLFNSLSGAECFGEFKRSPQYVHLLAELDLLKEPAESLSLTASLLSSNKPDITTSTPSVDESEINDLSPCNNAASLKMLNSSSSLTGPTNISNNQSNTMRASVNNIGPHTEIYSGEIIRAENMRDNYVVYTIRVTCTSIIDGHTETWNTLRRFSQFDELHSFIVDRCGRIPGLKLPSKRAFSNMNRDFVARRRRELNRYLSIICNPEFFVKYPASRHFVVRFLQPDTWDRNRLQIPVVSALMTSFRSVGNAVMSVPDTLADGFNKIFSGRNLQPNNPLFTNPEFMNSKSFGFELDRNSKSHEVLDMNNVDETPIRTLFNLVEEIFNLNRENAFTRQGNFVILRKVFQTFFGLRVNKIIISKAMDLISTHRLTQLFIYLRNYLWPPEQSNLTLGERDHEMRLRTRVLCRTILLGSISEELSQFLGNETTRRGVARFFNLFQTREFNRRFIHLVLEAILYQLFKPYQTHWESLYTKYLCPLHTGRPCRFHKTCPV